MSDKLVPAEMEFAIESLRQYNIDPLWLNGLSQVWTDLSHRWDLRFGSVLTGGQMSFCVRCTTSETEDAVLKIPMAAGMGALESTALELWARGGAAPEVLQTEGRYGAILMRFVEAQETGATEIESFAGLLGRLRIPDTATPAVPSLGWNLRMRSRWMSDLLGAADERDLIQPALELGLRLLEDQVHRNCLVHGDLQSKNIIRSRSGSLLAIDPLPGVGDQHFDAALWAITQNGASAIEETLADVCEVWDRCHPERLYDWARVLAVLAFELGETSQEERFRSFIASAW